MQQEMTLEDLVARRGAPVLGPDGERIGTIGEIQYEVDTRRPLYLSVNRESLGREAVHVPVEGARWQGDALWVPYTDDQLEGVPRFDDDTELTGDPHEQLDTYFGQLGGLQPVRKEEPAVDDAVAEEPMRREAVADETPSLTLHEEQLAVGKRPIAAGAVRIRKWVETEPVEMDVELRHETARIVREEINEPVSGVEIGEAEIEIPLQAEQAVVQKQTVAKERITVEKAVETELHTVAEEVRRERVEVEDDTGRSR